MSSFRLAALGRTVLTRTLGATLDRATIRGGMKYISPMSVMASWKLRELVAGSNESRVLKAA